MNAGEAADPESNKNKTAAQIDYEDGCKNLNAKELAMAANDFHNAMVGFEQEGNKRGVAQAADKLGDICKDKEEWDKAKEYYDRAYQICTDDFDRFSLFHLEKKKAEIYLKSGDLKQAMEAYLDILDEYNGLNDPQGSCKTLETIADIYLKQDQRDGAADCYRTMASIHKNFGHAREAQKLLDRAEATLRGA